MVSVNPNPAQGFYYFDLINMGLPGLNSVPPSNTAPPPQAPPPLATSISGTQRYIRRIPVRKSGSLTLLPSLERAGLSRNTRSFSKLFNYADIWLMVQLIFFIHVAYFRFDRDWKKIEAFVGSKTVIQIRSHAQKYFLKVQKHGTSEHVPPPRSKRKAAHPYPQKAPKNASVVPQVAGPFQSSSALHELNYMYRQDSSSVPGNPIAPACLSSRSFNFVPPVTVTQVKKDDVLLAGPTVGHNSCHSGSSESTHRSWSFGETINWGDHWKPSRVLPDFAMVYSFIGSVFDPGASGHLQKLKQMDPINLETVLLLMRNLSVNLTSPYIEDHRRVLSANDAESEGVKLLHVHILNSASAVPTV